MTDTPMTPDRDPSRREELLFMLLHGGARDAAIAQRVVDLALAEARAEQKAEVDRLRGELSDATAEMAENARAMNAIRRHRDTAENRVRELEEQERFLERSTLPDLHRQIEHHKDGKARWRKRAETAEARVAELTITPANEVVEMAEAEAELEAMRREHPAPCRVPDSPDCTCPDKLPVFTGADWDGPIARCSWGAHMAALLPSGRIARHRMGEGWLNACPGVGKPPRAEEETAS
ncbi:hypothetical protein [Streptomyces sp. SP18CM02]|uniref:hypothetical protein n=1 Tax=Streptomyces sp. SP18CM02 TaxID=2758571 RepID=UPI00168BA873|nr:hypothetical protein [Streptomyces sp. SP18CM02]MBD3550823.1 hypothetical protein [Streptomyces sp. SP18CM02]